MPSIVQKDQEAAVWVPRLQQPATRDIALGKLRELYPSWEFVWEGSTGLSIYLPENWHSIPRALAFAASYIERVSEDGYEVIKHRDGPQGYNVRTKPPPRTCFERVLGDDEF